MARVLAIDLDGTLLSSRGEAFPDALARIRELSSRGWLVIICTARPVRAVKLLLPDGFGEDYWATCNGAWIVEQGVVVARTEMPFRETARLVENLLARGLWVQVEANDTLYSDRQPVPGFVGEYRPLWEYGGSDACKVLVNVSTSSQIREVSELLPDHLSMVVTDGATLVQVAHRDCTKLNAVGRICSMEGLGLEDVVAFGDDHNDTELIRAAGLGVAMANAAPAVLEVADRVAGSNDENGVGEVLRGLARGDWPEALTRPAG